MLKIIGVLLFITIAIVIVLLKSFNGTTTPTPTPIPIPEDVIEFYESADFKGKKQQLPWDLNNVYYLFDECKERNEVLASRQNGKAYKLLFKPLSMKWNNNKPVTDTIYVQGYYGNSGDTSCGATCRAYKYDYTNLKNIVDENNNLWIYENSFNNISWKDMFCNSL